MNGEANIPAFYSGLLLALNAVLLAVVWRLQRQGSERAGGWLALSLLFLFLSFDELFQVHEELIDPLRETFDSTGLLYYPWVVAYGAGVVVIAVLFYPLWRSLERHVRTWMAFAAGAYLAGAVVFEMLGGARTEAVGTEGDFVYGALYTAEESLEMAGLVLFAYALLFMLARARVTVATVEDAEHVTPGASATTTEPAAIS